jgi:hypothetical protein
LGSQDAANLSILFDIGGIFGGILAGLLSDMTGMSAFTCAGYFILTIPSVKLNPFRRISLDKYSFQFRLVVPLPRIRRSESGFECFFTVPGGFPGKRPVRSHHHSRLR